MSFRRRLVSALSPVRRRTPTFVLQALARRREARYLASPELMQHARIHMTLLLGRTDPARIEEATRAYVHRSVQRNVLRWKPRSITRQPVQGLDKLAEVRAAGRGLIVNFAHHGQYDGIFASLDRAGLPNLIVFDPLMLDATAASHMRQHLRVTTSRSKGIRADEARARVPQVLRDGGVVAIASDMPGTAKVRAFGRDLGGAFGAVSFSFKNNAPVTVCTTRRGDDGKPVLHLSDPLEPSDFTNAAALLDEIVRQHEEAMLAWPEYTDKPGKKWTILPGNDDLDPPAVDAWRI